jgi:hypothetical protein
VVIRSNDRQRIGKPCHGQANSAGMTESGERLIGRSRITVSGYWKSGETDFRDAEGDER